MTAIEAQTKLKEISRINLPRIVKDDFRKIIADFGKISKLENGPKKSDELMRLSSRIVEIEEKLSNINPSLA